MKKRTSSRTATGKAAATAPKGRPDYRKDRVLIAAYLDRSVKAGLRMIQVQHVDRSVQDLMAEAFADLFVKYGVSPAIGCSRQVMT